MTEAVEESTTEVARLSRVSVLCGGAQLDVSLPLQTPTEVLIPELVRLFGDRVEGAAEAAWARPWRLAAVGSEPLPGPQTPADAGITDGELLVLFVADAPPPPPVFDDVFDRAAGELSTDRRWDESTAQSVGLVVLGISTLATAAIALLRGLQSAGAGSAVTVFLTLWCAAAALGLLAGGIIVARRDADVAVPTVLSLCAAVLAATAGALAVPLTGGAGYGAAHLLLGSAAAGAVALIAVRFTRAAVRVHTSVITAAVLTMAAAGGALVIPGHRAAIAATTAVLAYVAIVFSARIGAVAARMPLPRVPAAGERIDPIDDDPPPTVAGVGAVASGLTDQTQAAPNSALAQSVGTGISVGASLAAAVAGLAVGAFSGDAAGHEIAFAIVIAIALCLRGRTHVEPVAAAAAILSGAAIGVGTAVSLAWNFDGVPAVAVAGIALIGAVGLACGVAAPKITFSPVQRRLAEIAEYLTIAAAGPLLGWVWDVYSTVRNI